MFYCAIVLTAAAGVSALECRFGVGLNGILDNREYDNTLEKSQTIFGIRAVPSLSLLPDSFNEVGLGISAIHEFGNRKFLSGVSPVMYYRFTGRPNTFVMGVFPRAREIAYPRILLSDSMRYFRPNIEGAFYQYAWSWGSQNIWVDWTGRQTASVREAFLTGISGQARFKALFVTNHFLYFHNANRGVVLPGDHVQDNVGLVLRGGARFLKVALFDSIVAAAGAVASADQDRGSGDGYHSALGGLGEVELATRWGGLDLTLYRGEGNHLEWGDRFYRAKTYGRCEFYCVPLKTSSARATFGLVLHYIEGQLDHSEQFMLDVSIGHVSFGRVQAAHSLP